jgi:hypothetical protein
MIIKVNNITNLADARYAAALGVDYLCFAQERGSLYKVPKQTVHEILPWIEGPQSVLAYGHDYEGAHLAVAETQQFNLWQEYDWRPLQDIPGGYEVISGGRFGLVLRLRQLHGGHLLVDHHALLRDAAQHAQYLEVEPLPTFNTYQVTDLLKTIRALVPQHTPVLLTLDGLAPHLQQAGMPLAQGFAFGQKLHDDFTQLDYDAFEKLLDLHGPERRLS